MGGLLIVLAMWWLYFDQTEHALGASLRTTFIWGYGHLFIFAAAAAVGADLAVAVDQATHYTEIGPVGSGAAVAIPVALYLVSLWLLQERAQAENPSHKYLFPTAIILILLTPFTGQTILLTGLLLVALLNKPAFTLAELWLGRSIAPEDNLRDLIFRYLAAFGPAAVTDMQTWSGLTKLKEVFETLKPELQTYRDENRRQLFDLLDGPLPPADVPAPVRFLPEFDNLLLSHSNRTRVVADETRAKVYLPGLRVAATILVDGFVRGVWKIEKAKNVATLVIEPLATLTKQERDALSAEAEQLVRFVEPQANAFAVRFVE